MGSSHNNITICVPQGTDVTHLVADFSSNAETVVINGEKQESGVSVNDFSQTVYYTLCSKSGVKQYSVNVYAFNLPSVWITTPDLTAVTSKTRWKKDAVLSLYDCNTGEKIDSYSLQIKGCDDGVPWDEKKKPYTLKLSDNLSLLGMPNGTRWDLKANSLDDSDIRNDIAFELARRSPDLSWSPRGVFVELFLDGIHQGNYYLCEHIKIAENRVNIREQLETNPATIDESGGYLLMLDSSFNETLKFRSSVANLPISLKTPDWAWYNKAYIAAWLDTLERMLASDKIPEKVYRDYLNLDSFVDYYIVNELTMNEALTEPKGGYMFKDRDAGYVIDKKIHAGPVWDFERSMRLNSNYEGWRVNSALWYPFLISDPYFIKRLKEKWNAQKGNYQDVADVYIASLRERLRLSVNKDISLWSGKKDVFDSVVNDLQSCLRSRIQWMDTAINAMVVDFDEKGTGNENYQGQNDLGDDFNFDFRKED